MTTSAYPVEILVEPAALLAEMDADMNIDGGERSIKLLDVRLGELYSRGHLPGAIHFSVYGINTYDTDEAPLRSFVHMWAFLLSQRGMRPSDRVVVYGSMSGMSAARAFWFLEYLGYGDVRVLNGGFERWHNEGLATTCDAELPKPVATEYEPRPELVATYEDVLRSIDDPATVILDTRSEAEWNGTDARAKRNGTIPSAVHQDWNAHLTEDGRLKPAAELAALFDAIGCDADKSVIAFCNTGYRSAHAYLALRLLGHRAVRNYLGSWQEWGNRDGCPVVVPGSER